MAQYWLMKSEPDVYSIDRLQQEGATLWEGVRNYQARNYMSQSMKVGDIVFFYHSSCEPAGIAGLAVVGGPAVPDPTQFDKKSDYFDPKATQDNPRWFCVNVKFQKKFPRVLELSEIKKHAVLKDMLVTRPGQRLSIQPVEEKHAATILKEIESK